MQEEACRHTLSALHTMMRHAVHRALFGAHSTIVGLIPRHTSGRIAQRQAQWLIPNFIQHQLPTHQLPQNTIAR